MKSLDTTFPVSLRQIDVCSQVIHPAGSVAQLKLTVDVMIYTFSRVLN